MATDLGDILLTPTLFIIAYELCHKVHGGPKRRILAREAAGRIAATTIACVAVGWGVIDWVMKERPRGAVPVPCGEESLGVLAGERWAAEVMLGLAGGCLWARLRWPWLTVLSAVELVLHATPHLFPSTKPYTTLLQSLVLSYALFLSKHIVTSSALASIDDEATQPLVSDESFEWLRRYGSAGTVEVWVDGQPASPPGGGPSDLKIPRPPSQNEGEGSAGKDNGVLSRFDSVTTVKGDDE
ncbi:hypothetical protein HDV00_005958 [Rhizophlyctis rosea]|nr:hypothetical protein HDV00_005958 [Rhizophlyctis rosea]